MQRVLLMRQEEESLAVATLLRSRGVDSCIYPLVKPHFIAFSSLSNPQGLIITSKNALRAIEGREDLKELPLYVVGDQTAQFAKNKGFLNVFSASGTSKELTSLLLQRASRHKGMLWHLSGDIVDENIVTTLQTAGFDAQKQSVYQMEDVDTLPSSLVHELQTQSISHVLFFSPRTTSLFMNLLKKSKLKKMTHQMTALCLSQNVVEKALALKWSEIWVSQKPTMHDLVRYFDAR